MSGFLKALRFTLWALSLRGVFLHKSVFYEKNGWFVGAHHILQPQHTEKLFPVFYLYKVRTADGREAGQGI